MYASFPYFLLASAARASISLPQVNTDLPRLLAEKPADFVAAIGPGAVDFIWSQSVTDGGGTLDLSGLRFRGYQTVRDCEDLIGEERKKCESSWNPPYDRSKPNGMVLNVDIVAFGLPPECANVTFAMEDDHTNGNIIQYSMKGNVKPGIDSPAAMEKCRIPCDDTGCSSHQAGVGVATFWNESAKANVQFCHVENILIVNKLFSGHVETIQLPIAGDVSEVVPKLEFYNPDVGQYIVMASSCTSSREHEYTVEITGEIKFTASNDIHDGSHKIPDTAKPKDFLAATTMIEKVWSHSLRENTPGGGILDLSGLRFRGFQSIRDCGEDDVHYVCLFRWDPPYDHNNPNGVAITIDVVAFEMPPECANVTFDIEENHESGDYIDYSTKIEPPTGVLSHAGMKACHITSGAGIGETWDGGDDGLRSMVDFCDSGSMIINENLFTGKREKIHLPIAGDVTGALSKYKFNNRNVGQYIVMIGVCNSHYYHDITVEVSGEVRFLSMDTEGDQTPKTSSAWATFSVLVAIAIAGAAACAVLRQRPKRLRIHYDPVDKREIAATQENAVHYQELEMTDMNNS